ncbi:MAG: hypothetical protein EOP07_03775 [Proteobacteria bacterium]|nr:MAG: hypothetical protein EOP07_03775 [Pseudomonadota bacterium]
MKLLRYSKNSMKVLCLALLLNACAGGEEGEEAVDGNEMNNAADAEENGNGENGNETGFNEESNNSNENLSNNNANMNNENLGNNGNNLLNNENLGAEANAAPAANEFVNNAAGENFLANDGAANAAAEAPADLSVTQNSTEDLGIPAAGDTMVGNQDAGAQTNVAPPNANMGATDTSLAAPAATSGGTVRYITRSGTSAYDRPQGQVVKNYEQGDHPVVTADGEWVRTSDGMFVPSSSVTTRPVPRAKSAKSWR